MVGCSQDIITWLNLHYHIDHMPLVFWAKDPANMPSVSDSYLEEGHQVVWAFTAISEAVLDAEQSVKDKGYRSVIIFLPED